MQKSLKKHWLKKCIAGTLIFGAITASIVPFAVSCSNQESSSNTQGNQNNAEAQIDHNLTNYAANLEIFAVDVTQFNISNLVIKNKPGSGYSYEFVGGSDNDDSTDLEAFFNSFTKSNEENPDRGKYTFLASRSNVLESTQGKAKSDILSNFDAIKELIMRDVQVSVVAEIGLYGDDNAEEPSVTLLNTNLWDYTNSQKQWSLSRPGHFPKEWDQIVNGANSNTDVKKIKILKSLVFKLNTKPIHEAKLKDGKRVNLDIGLNLSNGGSSSSNAKSIQLKCSIAKPTLD